MSEETGAPEGWAPIETHDPFEQDVFGARGPGAEGGTISFAFYDQVEDGQRVFAFRPELRHANGLGIVHGGAIMTFFDASLGSAAWDAVGRKPSVTLSLTSEFLSPARPGEWLICRPTVTRKARSVIFVRGEITVDDRLIATANSIWKVLGT
ncbi:PaaI family thioesterase [Oleomonas cavernae]|uniref:PaaI family thioesterase n=1 Tax=Oleomonas cavernae TaxID=2320859 RepID=A0A418WFY7_9PROT|nr:PaaI family thioesterase [Oleomonas cavernae]RJF88931.1 PaaI family thioesterase [Oleomonas cavernae]